MKNVFECEYCGEQKHNEQLMEFHEKNCSKNPKNEECYSCVHYDGICGEGIEATNENCLFYIEKEKPIGKCARCGRDILKGEEYTSERRIDGNMWCSDCY